MKRIAYLLPFLFSAVNVNAQSTVVDSMLWNGAMHPYRVYVPAVVKCALVVHLHGYGSSALLEQFYTNYMPIADTAGIVVAYPEGLIDQLGNRSWNVGWFGQTNNDDVGFISAFIDTIVERYALDLSSVFASGISNGGFMCHRLACELSNKIAAIASVSGGMTSGLYVSCSPINPVPVLEIHGTSDATIPYAGGGGVSSMHIDSVVKLNASLTNCNPNPQVTTLLHNAATVNGTSVEHYVYSDGTNNATCEFYKIINGTHINWPGFDNSTTNDFNASKEIWRFFSNYRSCNMVGINEIENETLNIFPNPTSDAINVNMQSNAYNKYELTDVMGKLLTSGFIDENSFTVDMNSYASGLYFLRLTGKTKQVVRKILVN